MKLSFLRQVKLKLGISKLNKKEYLNFLIRINNDLGDLLLKDKNVNKKNIEEYRSEINMYFWINGGSKLKSSKNPVIKEIIHDNLIDIMFNKIADNIYLDQNPKYDKSYLENLYKKRVSFYENSDPTSDLQIKEYYEKIYDLLFTNPFNSKDKAQPDLGLDMNFFDNFSKSQKMTGIEKNILTGYQESIDRLNGLVKK